MSDLLSKKDMVDAVVEKTGLTKAVSAEVIDSLLDVLSESLVEGKTVRFMGFGSFSTSERKARVGRNPKTGEEIQIAASNAVKFQAGKTLKTAVNEK